MNSVFGYTRDGESPTSPLRGRVIGLSIGLLWLIPLVVSILQEDGLRRVLEAAALLVFVAGYFAAGLVRDTWHDPITPRAWTLYGGFLALTVVLPLLLGGKFIALPIYASVISALFLPVKWVPSGLLGSTAAAFVVAELAEDGDLFVTLTAFSIGLLMAGFRHSRELVDQLRAARAEVARLAASEERLRIARDLHDLLGHSLSLIVLKSELATRMAERDPARSAEEMRDVNKVAREALTDVRATVSGYRQRTLAEELDSARAVLTAAGVTPVIRTSGTPLPGDQDALYAWTVREAVTNVVRHARATRCEIVVTPSSVEITDDGRGGGAIPGSGLNGLKERATASGGTADISGGPSGGFTVKVTL